MEYSNAKKAHLSARGIRVEYWMRNQEKYITALDDINLEIQAGEFITIVGPSGCGKTTLLNLITGLIPATSGQILLNDQVIVGPGTDRAMVFQDAALMPWRTVEQNVGYGLELQGKSKAEIETIAKEFIDLVGLTGFEHSFPNELSGGMQQRVNVARALAINPSILLLDEPLAALDAQTREYMQAELLRIWRELGNTAIFITHNIGEAIYLADRVIVMSARPGRIKTIIEIDMPRPRKLTDKRSPEFYEIERQIWRLLQEEHAFFEGAA
jgi:NitT/TauT family transport system ATP-binding protein